MATAIFFNGRRINVPQAVTRIDASALSSVTPAAIGIVALVGEAEGGEPLTVNTENDLTRAGQIFDRYRSGDLKTAALFAFEPSGDDAVPGGAQRIVPVKVNPATQASVTLPDGDPKDSVDLTSRDYGLFTSQINITVAGGTTQGKLITVVFESTTEVFDDVGGDPALTVEYTPGADGYDTCVGSVDATDFDALATKLEAELSAQMTSPNPVGLPAALEVVSSAAGDTTQSITIYGVAGGAAVQETVALNGTSAVATTAVTAWTEVHGGILDGAAAGTVTVRVVSGGATSFTLAPAALTAGVVQITNGAAAGVVTVTAGADAGEEFTLFGLDASGAAVGELYDLTTGNTVPVVGAQTFSEVQVMGLGGLTGGGAASASLSLTAAQTLHSTFGTIQKVVDRLNSLPGFTATSGVSNPTTFDPADLDYISGVTLIGGGGGDFLADLFFFIQKLNQESQFVSAARATGATSVPANTAAPVFLSGGVEGTTTITQWTAAFELLRKRDVNVIVPLTNDPAVHFLLLSHLRNRAGKDARIAGEANGYIGLGTAGGAGETRSSIKSQIQTIQSRHISAISQEVERFDPDSGNATFYSPHIFASIAAGMQAGSAIGEPLTRKRPLVTDIRNDSSWSVEDDVEELIDAGLMIFEKVDNVGIRCVRSITTHLADDNVVFTEMSANESANTAIRRLRRQLELRIGTRALRGTVAAIKGLANDELSRLIDEEIIFAYRALQVEQVGDVFPVSVEIAPILPVNFIPITVHLVAARATAA